MKNWILTLVLLILASTQLVFAQKRIVLKGKVLDKTNNIKVIYANLFIEKHTIGTYTNKEGAFVIALPESIKNDTLIVSCVGYNTLKLKISDIKSKIIYLISKTNILEEVSIVSSYNPNKILKKAYKKRKQNYPYDEAYASKAYYREYFKKDNKTVQMLELVANIKEKGLQYNPLKNTEVKIDSIYQFYRLDSKHIYGSLNFLSIFFRDGIKKYKQCIFHTDSVFFIDNEKHISITYVPKKKDTITYSTYSTELINENGQEIKVESTSETKVKTEQSYQYSSITNIVVNLTDYGIIEYNASFSLLGEPEKFALKMNKKYYTSQKIHIKYKKQEKKYYPLQIRRETERIFVTKKDINNFDFKLNTLQEYIFINSKDYTGQINQREYRFYEDFIEDYKDIMFPNKTINLFENELKNAYLKDL